MRRRGTVFSTVWNDNKGYSLIEVIITMALVSIVMSFLAASFSTTVKTFNRITRMTEAKSLANQISNGIVSELSSAKQLQIAFKENSDGVVTGRIVYEKGDMLYQFPESGGEVVIDDGLEAPDGDGGDFYCQVVGKPVLRGAVYDVAVYGDYTVDVTVTFGDDINNISSLFVMVKVYEGEGADKVMLASVPQTSLLYNYHFN